STHNCVVTIHGHDTRVLFDGGACVSVCSPQFLQRVGITDFDPVSSIGIQTIQGRAKVLGEVRGVPICFGERVVFPVSCVIIDAPFDILLGRGFMEAADAATDWKRSAYWMYSQDYGIFIDATGKTAPLVYRKDSPEWRDLSPPPSIHDMDHIPALSRTPAPGTRQEGVGPLLHENQTPSAITEASSDSSDSTFTTEANSSDTDTDPDITSTTTCAASALEDIVPDPDSSSDSDNSPSSDPDTQDEDFLFAQALFD
ncbi:hypothetical protein BG006_004904, partial [Podila minutissima]